ncbi:DENN domain-containing protein 1A isoform X5 [Tympanuchus pallidicinctus]|uniref:DENN domain-containing protein 1A isoform X5 n=1 Tax=Tympanuchus pallidicinctus TaxID=109042 RepID=UPI002286E97C|nr:DENN domain-containing protein 1A isoform X5 [Tympanuchus pallidicinctus]
MGSRIKQNPETTFEVYAEVTYSGISCIGKDPEVRRQFPEDYSDQEVLQTLTKFCFPFYMDSHAVSQVGQNFTFVLTDIDSKQRFGFCRLSSGAKSCFCILSYLPWFEVFYKLLNVLADYSAKGQDNQRNELLETFHKLSIPEPKTPVQLGLHSYFTVPDIRELPSIPENLTACIHGSAAMLYPMFWQHVYIPVLPPHLLDYCCAPMPYLIGIHLSLMEKVRNMALEDVVILNVDTNTLETPFDDLQSLPNDVVSALKNRLKKVSTTTGDGVARAFLKAQASFFGSYRNALKIEPGEPITFCEETFVSHRSAVMRQFLQNAIQLQLFKQFIDGRLDLLNSGEGFNDAFEEEINMGEYAGSDKLYLQWLSTVRKGSGAILNTVKTKANPAMKTVYKFAKDHAKMGIKEVKNRLKQKDVAENGCSAAPEQSLPRPAPSPLVEKKDTKLREDRRPITVHFGQQQRLRPPRPPPPKIQRSTRPVRPPRPHVVKRPKSNIAVEGRRTSISSPEHLVKPMRHYTVFLSEDSSDDEFQQEEDPVSGFSENFFFSAPFEWPQPYRALKESDSADGEEAVSPEKAKEPLPPSPLLSSNATEINLLEDIFPNLEVETQPQTLSQAKSLEDLRTPKEEADQRCTFDYQRMDLAGSERNRIVPPMKLSHPYNKLWNMGHDDMAIPTKYSQSSPERPLTALGNVPPITRRPRSRDSILASAEKDDSNPAAQGNITIPRPQGRKTPELGIVPPPPAPRASKHQTPTGPTEILSAHTGCSQLVSDLIPEPLGVARLSLEPEVQQSVNYSSCSSQLLSSATSTAEMLQPVRVKTDNTGNESDYLLNLLDPLKAASWQSSGPQQGSCSLQSSVTPPSGAGFISVASDFVPPPAAPFIQSLSYPSPALPPFLQASPNPFTQTVPGPLSVSLVRPPRGSFTPTLGHAYSSSFITPNSSLYPPHRPQPNISTLSMPNLFSQAPAMSPAGSLLLQSHSPSPASSLQPACLSGPSKTRTLHVGKSTSKVDTQQALALLSNEPPLIPSRPAKGLESVLLSSKPEETKDPFEDLLKKTKQDVSSTPGKVEQLRRQWETFE